MTIQEMQQRVDQWISQFTVGYFPPEAMVLRLAEELGELAREVNHGSGLKPKKATEPDSSVAMELGDLLFVVISFANSLGLDLKQVFLAVMAKFEQRDHNRWPRRPSADAPDAGNEHGA